MTKKISQLPESKGKSLSHGSGTSATDDNPFAFAREIVMSSKDQTMTLNLAHGAHRMLRARQGTQYRIVDNDTQQLARDFILKKKGTSLLFMFADGTVLELSDFYLHDATTGSEMPLTDVSVLAPGEIANGQDALSGQALANLDATPTDALPESPNDPESGRTLSRAGTESTHHERVTLANADSLQPATAEEWGHEAAVATSENYFSPFVLLGLSGGVTALISGGRSLGAPSGATVTSIVSGQIVAGAVISGNDLVLTLYKEDGVTVLATATLDAQGKYSVTISTAAIASIDGAQGAGLTAAQLDALSSVSRLSSLSGTALAAAATSVIGSLDGTQVSTLTSAQLEAMYQADFNAGGTYIGDSAATKLQNLAYQLTSLKDATNDVGTANGTNALNLYINRITGTDIVSASEFSAGFSISGHATANATVSLYLDNNRTDGVDQIGTLLTTVTADTSGNWNYNFAASSASLLQATHGVAGSGVHQITAQVGGSTIAERLFLVASGTAQVGDTGLVTQNYSVRDLQTGTIFVYYYGDPDSTGIGLWTTVDPSGLAALADRDSISSTISADYDYGISATAPSSATTSAGYAAGLKTSISSALWEFGILLQGSTQTWSGAQAAAGNHGVLGVSGSNTSRLPSLEELLAVYAANFSGSSTPGAVQAMTDASSVGTVAGEDNRPTGWANTPVWAAAPSLSGHVAVNFTSGHLLDYLDSNAALYGIVL